MYTPVPNPPPYYQETFSYYTPDVAVREYNRMVTLDRNRKPLLAALREKGYEVSDDDGFGAKYEIAPTPIDDIPSGYTHGDPNIINYEFDLLMIKLHPNSGEEEDPAAICLAKLTPKSSYLTMESIQHDSIITAVRNDFMNVEEEVFEGGAFGEKDNSWWTRLMSRIQDCGGTCVGAAIGCPKVDWTAFLACLAGRCGECLVKAAACATCGCKGWCNWAAGCCQ